MPATCPACGEQRVVVVDVPMMPGPDASLRCEACGWTE